MKYIIVLDAGTTSVRAFVYDLQSQRFIHCAQQPVGLSLPHSGWVEQDADEIYYKSAYVINDCMRVAGAENVARVGIANQREAVVMWNRETGEPVCPVIGWQCRRTSAWCAALDRQTKDRVRARTGLVPDAYFSASKIVWNFEHIPAVRALFREGKLCAGTIDSYLIYKFTEHRSFVTDVTNASRTMLFNINTLRWDEEILKILDIPVSMLPEARPSSCQLGMTDPRFFGGAIPIGGAAGDQQAALFGQTCFAPGEAKNTYGTGCFLLMNTGETPVFSENGLVTTIAWGMDGKITYALEGSVFVAGAVIQWLRDELRLIDSAEDSEYMAKKVKDTHGCYVVPAFTGLGAPYWDQYARGTIVGLTRGVNKCHIIRAALESLAYQVHDVIEAMRADSGIELNSLKVDGGASANNFLMQTQADMIQVPVKRPVCVETTAMGAAYLAGLAVGYWNSPQEIISNWEIDRVFTPEISVEERDKKAKGWKKAVKCAYGWAKEEDDD